MAAETTPPSETRFTLLDGAALVMGSAVASVQLRPLAREGSSTAGLIGASLVFAWLAATATGPFVYLVRRFVRPTTGPSGIGERLWALLGTPWLLGAVFRSAGTQGGAEGVYPLVMAGSVAAASLIAFLTTWQTWVAASPEEASRVGAGAWPNRIGLVLAIAWPIQCGLAFVVLG
ncbi:hypothetical protein [Planctomyces sp. SH-PL62]|uniref:hypothetical protein n=1 Tax=Planctomyces sp. SH-PL62 TaxID=1636152 RepID=UPI00078B7C73|nr:hypothetical protein [Planctomyces sp. SH-PL62]AMV39745.1 hypothetical protein VT85_20095 [Planctomyces sp. SH-PL62]